MKILLISYYHSDNQSVGSLRSQAILKYLPFNGIEVDVLVAKNQSQDLIFDKNIISVKDINDKSKTLLSYVWRAFQKILRTIGFYRGIHLYWKNTAIAYSQKILEHSQPNIILASYPCIEALEIGIYLSNKNKLPLVVDFRDGLLFEPLEMKLLKKPRFQAHYEIVERLSIQSARLVVAISQPIIDYFTEKYGCLNTLTLPNGYDDEDYVGSQLNDFHFDKGLIHIVHTGRISLSREISGQGSIGLSSLSKALSLLSESYSKLYALLRIHFVGFLSHNEVAILKSHINRGVVIFWGERSRMTALEFQRKADFLLLITAVDLKSLATGKIFEYLSANKKILALTRGTEAEQIIKKTGAGVNISPDDPFKILDCLIFILKGGQLNCVRNNLVIDSYARSVQMKLLASHLKQILY